MTLSIRTQAIHNACKPKPRSIWARMMRFAALRRQREHLAALEDHLLDDIGVTRAQARAESVQSPWNAPEHWHK